MCSTFPPSPQPTIHLFHPQFLLCLSEIVFHMTACQTVRSLLFLQRRFRLLTLDPPDHFLLRPFCHSACARKVRACFLFEILPFFRAYRQPFHEVCISPVDYGSAPDNPSPPSCPGADDPLSTFGPFRPVFVMVSPPFPQTRGWSDNAQQSSLSFRSITRAPRRPPLPPPCQRVTHTGDRPFLYE